VHLVDLATNTIVDLFVNPIEIYFANIHDITIIYTIDVVYIVSIVYVDVFVVLRIL